MKKLKVTLIGYGYWGKKLARNFQNSENFVLTSISDSKRNNLIAAKKNYPLAKLYKDFKKSVKFLKLALILLIFKFIILISVSLDMFEFVL